MYDHLLAFSSSGSLLEQIDLFLYSVGGRMDVPWRIVTMIREFCRRLNVIVPYKAYSAATLIALGADKIVMGRKGELSPIDPALQVLSPEGIPSRLPPQIGVEDIASYITFIKERAGLTDQAALAQSINILAQEVTPPVLGQIQRAHSHIRLVGSKMLGLCQPRIEERQARTIVEALTEKIYLHGHGIGRKEAKEIGLQVEEPSPSLEELLWKLYLSYENLLKLDTTGDAQAYFSSDEEDEYREPETKIACIESTMMAHVFEGELLLKRIRKVPSQLAININLPVQLPLGMRPEQVPPQVQQSIQQMAAQSAEVIRQQVIRQIVRQSPVERIERRLVGSKWVRTD
jgi:hypothetical protein